MLYKNSDNTKLNLYIFSLFTLKLINLKIDWIKQIRKENS